MSASPFQFSTLRLQDAVVHSVESSSGVKIASRRLGQDKVQALISEHLKAIDELSGVETVAMIRLPVSFNELGALFGGLREEHVCGPTPNELTAEATNGWLRVWKK